VFNSVYIWLRTKR